MCMYVYICYINIADKTEPLLPLLYALCLGTIAVKRLHAQTRFFCRQLIFTTCKRGFRPLLAQLP